MSKLELLAVCLAILERLLLPFSWGLFWESTEGSHFGPSFSPLLAASPQVDCAAVRTFGQVQLVPGRHIPANFCAGAVELGWELGRIRIIPPPLQLLETDTQRTGKQSRNLNHWVVGYPTPSALRASTTPHKVGALLASDTDSE